MDTLAATRQRVEEAASEADRLAALQMLASALFEYDASEAVAVADQAIELAQRLGDHVARTWARHNRAWALSALGHLDEALSEQLAVLQEFENRGDTSGIAHFWPNSIREGESSRRESRARHFTARACNCERVR